MTRTLRFVVVLTLVIGTIGLVQTTDHEKIVASAQSDFTWEQLNETILLLEDYIDQKFNNSVDELKDYIDTKISFNTTGNNTNINLEMDFDEEAILSAIENESATIRTMMGAYGSDETIYDDLSAILNGLVDKHGDYILEKSNGESMFTIVVDNQNTLSENQKTIVDKIEVEHNYTRANIESEHDSTRKEIDKAEKSIIAGMGDGLFSILAGLGVTFLIIWIFILKPRLQNSYAEDAGYPEENNPAPEHKERKSIVDGIKARNPLRIRSVSAAEPPPDCYLDGKSYDPYNEMACNTCPYAKECEDKKLEIQAAEELRQRQEEENKKRNSPIHHGYDMGEINETIPDNGSPLSSGGDLNF